MPRLRRTSLVVGLSWLLLGACAGDAAAPADAAVPDAVAPDAAVPDAVAPDAAVPDARDAAAPDAADAAAPPTVCTIDGAEYAAGVASPADPCRLCAPDISPHGWSPAPAGTPCAAANGWDFDSSRDDQTCHEDGLCCRDEVGVCFDGACGCDHGFSFGGCYTECEFLREDPGWQSPDWCQRHCGARCCDVDSDCDAAAPRCVPTGSQNPSGICLPEPVHPQCWSADDCAADEVCDGETPCPCWYPCPEDGPGTCVPRPACEDGRCDPGETCGLCPTDCGPCPADCGDGVTDATLGEDCDDGNATDWDGCSTECRPVEVQVNETPTGSQRDARVAGLADGGWVVTWSDIAPTGATSAVFARSAAADGSFAGPERRISPDDGPDDAAPTWNAAVAGLSDGGFVALTVTAAGADRPLSALLVAADGTGPSAPSPVCAGSAEACAEPALAACGDGFLVAWSTVPAVDEPRSVRVRAFAADGTPRGAAVQAEPAADPGDDAGAGAPALACRPGGGGCLLAWAREGDDGSAAPLVLARTVDCDGRVTGPAQPLVQPETGCRRVTRFAVALRADGAPVLAWEAECRGSIGWTFDLVHREAWFAVLDPAGAAPRERLARERVPDLWGWVAPQFAPTLAVSSAGAVALWSERTGPTAHLLARAFAPDGAPLGPAAPLDTYPWKAGVVPAAAAGLADGSVVTAWESCPGFGSADHPAASPPQDGDGCGVFLRRVAVQP